MDLVLPLKREYFEQIKAGTKTEEYRIVSDYWRARLYLKKYKRIVLTLGYPKRTDTERRLVLPYKGYVVKQITHPHFGPAPVHVFALDVRHNVRGNRPPGGEADGDPRSAASRRSG
jgi:hypothetical protein